MDNIKEVNAFEKQGSKEFLLGAYSFPDSWQGLTMDKINEENGSKGQNEVKTRFVLGTYYYSDPCEEPYTQDLGIIVNLSEGEDLMLHEMKKIAKPILENLKNVEIKNVEDLRFQETLSSDIDLSEEEVKSFRFQYKENGEWEFDFGLFIREYIKYENDSEEFKDLVDEGILEVI